ncbi:dTDP-4-dehydrorhamnose reductase [Tepidibacter formicigenes]|uniref:dTDP-4-dehydrorhamnose reductase n=1 Tax=Tepidibacter formicigenes DSM 15518 TaxID=1123349 RepID=A0A1M6TEA3_9FIRM|nr:dTDP-4-dehydrorhamnose reductase [Tepidibacter formicigenes]SHK55300.1 dTDP-4-dehydrorhamnose reductase [Tepidibacter formicigenes DSM 15518]
MKILVTGSNGQLGIDIVNTLSKKYEVVGLDSKDLDITNLDNVLNTVKEIKPDIIINSAAYTNVDGCEENIDLAYKVNGLGARNLAISSFENNSRLLHISTDFVFDGEKNEPYIEFDNTNPLSIYGKSKLAGENYIKEICPRHYILRTAWLYGKNGNNFVKTMLRLAENNKTLKVVDDQIGSPTYTMDLVKVIEMIIKTDAYGTYHVSNDGSCSWNEFAKKIFEFADFKDIQVLPISTEEFGRPAQRPKYSVMRNYMLELDFNYYIRNWEEALKEYFSKM